MNKPNTYRLCRWISYFDCMRARGYKGGWRWFTQVGMIVKVRATNVDVIRPGIYNHPIKVPKARIIEIWGDGPTECGPSSDIRLTRPPL